MVSTILEWESGLDWTGLLKGWFACGSSCHTGLHPDIDRLWSGVDITDKQWARAMDWGGMLGGWDLYSRCDELWLRCSVK